MVANNKDDNGDRQALQTQQIPMSSNRQEEWRENRGEGTIKQMKQSMKGKTIDRRPDELNPPPVHGPTKQKFYQTVKLFMERPQRIY